MSHGVLVNGLLPTDRAHALAVDDRGVQYGDGLFETMLLTGGRIRYLEDHLARLEEGCRRLRIACPERALLLKDVGVLVAGKGEGVLKIIVTRGPGGRGYRPDARGTATRIVSLHSAIESSTPPGTGITATWCETRLARNAALAGIKHLNRLEQVLAQSEWSDPGIAEGLMRDTEGEVVSATAGNLFLVRDGILCTSDLRYCGIRGVMRGRVIEAARSAGWQVEEQPLWSSDLDAASEVFITNAVRGIRPVVALGESRWEIGEVAARLAASLSLW